jgi:hypothetical protein
VNTVHDNKTLEEADLTRSLSLQIDNWETNIEHIPKLSSVCFTMKTATSFTKTGTSKLVYFV